MRMNRKRERNGSGEKHTIKERLTSFFVLMGGTALLMCLFTLVFSLAFYQRYRQAIGRLSVFNQYCDNLDQASENAKYFFQTEEGEYWQSAQEQMEVAMEGIGRLYGEEDNPLILREVQDVREMTERFYCVWQALTADLQENSQAGGQEISRSSVSEDGQEASQGSVSAASQEEVSRGSVSTGGQEVSWGSVSAGGLEGAQEDIQESTVQENARESAGEGAEENARESGQEDTTQVYGRIQEEYGQIEDIHEAIRERYLDINQLILQDIEGTHEAMEQRTRVYVAVFLIMFTAMCAGMFWQIQHISRSVSEPIGVLARKAELIREGKPEAVLELPAPERSEGEISGLIQIFDKMAGQVKTQIETLEENARIRQELEESRFKELQMQINPHFLFNTLNMIAEKAYLEQADETVELLETAARMFRYSLDFSGKTVKLSQELEELGDYVFMQEQRFGSRITFVFELDEVFHDMTVPAMILQPLVENAIVHGTGMRTEDARIRIRTRWSEEEGSGYVVVEDNGEGMDGETLRAVRKSMEEYGGESPKIGLGNVYLRLKMFFGGRAAMTVESRAGEGTRVTLRLPREGKDEVCTD